MFSSQYVCATVRTRLLGWSINRALMQIRIRALLDDPMIHFNNVSKFRFGIVSTLFAIFVVGCSSRQDPILGTPDVGIAPTIATLSPLNTTPVVTGVALGSSVAITFSKPMNAATITSTTFTLACPAGTPVAASVAYNAATQVATLTPTTALPPNTLCVATVTTAVQDSQGFALANNTVWSFMTAATADTTRPTVTLTAPAAGAVNVPTNSKITATFSEAMNAATMSGASFSVMNTTNATAVTGTVVYSVNAKTATFTPSPATLVGNYTATITTAVTDVAGNALAVNYVWSFTAVGVADVTAPTVTAVSPADASTGNCLTRLVSATFSESMDATTISATTFKVTDSGVAVAGSVSYDAASRIASFVPTAAAGFGANKTFVATITSGANGVTDLAGNALAVDKVWSFATGTQACTSAVNLRTIAAFGAFGGGAGATNQGINTVVNGNLGTTAACTLITGFHDATNVYTETTSNVGVVNGTIYCAPPLPGTTTSLSIATQARADANTAYNDLAALPPGSDPGAGQLGGLTLTPATYTSAGGTFAVTTGDLTLDAQGDANATWVFQSASALTVGLNATPRRVVLINGAQAKNVFWKVGSAARIEDGSTMVGTIIAPAGVTISTAGQTIQTTLIGRAIGLTASVTMVNTTIVAP